MRRAALGAAAALAVAAAALGSSRVGDADTAGLAAGSGGHGSPAMPSSLASSRARADALIDRRWPHGASGTVLVARGGTAVVCRGLGWADRARRIHAGCDTAYDLMSMTKQFTAAGILKLQMMGRLRTSDRIGRFFADVPPAKRAITIQDLLDQTSGLIEALGDDYQPLSRERMIAEAMRSRPLSAPGRAFHYSNVNYSLLAAIVEQASGMDYEHFMRRYLFLPAGMRQTGYVLPHWRPRQIVVEYDRDGRSHGHPNSHPWAPDGPYWNLRGNGGMLSTAPDVLRWQRALLGDRILSAAAKRQLYTRRVQEEPGSPYHYADGWDILRTPAGPLATHNGGNGWSFGAIGRLLSRRSMAFWVSNHAYQRGRWNLEDLDPSFTIGLARRALAR